MSSLARLVIASACAAIVGIASQQITFADTFVVNNTADLVDDDLADTLCHIANGDCTLRAAIQQANATVGSDVIELPSGYFTLTLTGANEDAALTGDLDIRDSVVISGQGPEDSVIDGNLADRVMHIHNDNPSIDLLIVLRGLTLQRGSADATNLGCGMKVDSHIQLVLEQVNVFDNQCNPASYGAGGGLYLDSATSLQMSASEVSHNRGAAYGGGIATYGAVVITNSILSDNRSEDDEGLLGSGGAIYSNNTSGRPLQLNGVRVYDNAAAQGGGLYINNTRAVINHSVIVGNLGGDYGGLYIRTALLDLQNSAIVGNIAENSAGGLFMGSLSGGITNTTIANNRAMVGGGLYASDVSALIINNSTIAHNRASAFGGGVLIADHTLQLHNSIVADNAAANSPDCADTPNVDGTPSGTLVSLGHVLFGDGAGCRNYAPASGDLAGEAKLASLTTSNNGMPIVALLANSLAIDSGDDATCASTDQRDLPRTVDGNADGITHCDIGAYEVQGSSANLSGAVYADANRNGQWDAGEIGLPDVALELRNVADNGLINTSSTPHGTFAFSDLVSGTYVLREIQPVGYEDGLDALGNAANAGALDNDVMTITLSSNEQASGYTFGELALPTLSGVVYRDVDQDGVYSASLDTGINGVEITLSGISADGEVISCTTETDDVGAYTFASIPPGNYTLSERQPSDYFDYADTVGTVGGVLSEALPEGDVISGIVITYNQAGTGYNFGELLAVNITAIVYAERTGNGQLDYLDEAIANVLMTVSGSDYRGHPMIITQTTIAYGSYGYALFANLPPGTYTLAETQPIGYADGADTVERGPGVAGNDVVTGITLLNGSSGSYQFAEEQAGIAGVVFEDYNLNGILESERGISGVEVTLHGNNALGAAIVLTTVSDINGRFIFTNLPTGVYTISETQPVGYLDGLDQAGSLGGISGELNSDVVQTIIYSEGQTGVGYSFGEERGARIEGYTFIDDNGNLLFDNNTYLCYTVGAYCDPPLPNVTITLSGTDHTGASVYLTTQTISTTAPTYFGSETHARFVFQGLRAGTYSLVETQPTGYVDGVDVNPLGVISRSNDRFEDINVYYGGFIRDFAFGELPSGAQ